MSYSTIKIKNSNSAGNTPSSLSQGELAINVADGNLFYGDGTNVKQDIALANITASGNISASGFISASAFVGDGSGLTGLSSAAITTYNNASDNRVITSVNSTTVNSEANLTFDGSSLNVAGNYNIDSYNLASNSSGPDAIIISNDDNRQDIYFGKSTLAPKRVNIFGQLTASAEISSSEKITAKRVSVDDYISHNGNASNRIAFGTDTITLRS